MKYDNNYLKKIHSEILDIMDEIDRCCRDNSLKYYLVAGSLLGSIRHKGFIPWDDDLDIVMPRDNFDRFINDVYKELDSKYELKFYNKNPNYSNLFAKVCRKNTVFKDEENEEYGIFVDIFPLDKVKKYSNTINNRKRIVAKLRKTKYKNKNITYNKLINVIINKIMTIDNNKNYKYYVNYGSNYGVLRQTMPIEWYGQGKEYTFEKRKYIGPDKCELFLNQLYGSKYMELPPKEKRRMHYPKYVKFSDGEEMYFDEVKHKVSIKETFE